MIFKHEEDPGGALDAERAVAMAERSAAKGLACYEVVGQLSIHPARIDASARIPGSTLLDILEGLLDAHPVFVRDSIKDPVDQAPD